jgi:hypothetical protein
MRRLFFKTILVQFFCNFLCEEKKENEVNKDFIFENNFRNLKVINK